MLDNLFSFLTRLIVATVLLGLAVVIFFIGIIALWYILLFGTAIWLIRTLYRGWTRRDQGPIRSGDVEIIVHEEPQQPRPRPGRVIDHE